MSGRPSCNSSGLSLASKLSHRPQISKPRPKAKLGHNPKQGYSSISPSHTPWLPSPICGHNCSQGLPAQPGMGPATGILHGQRPCC